MKIFRSFRFCTSKIYTTFRKINFEGEKLTIFQYKNTPSEFKSSYYSFLLFCGIGSLYTGFNIYNYEYCSPPWLITCGLCFSFFTWKFISTRRRMEKIVLKLMLQKDGENISIIRFGKNIKLREDYYKIEKIVKDNNNKYKSLGKKGTVFLIDNEVFLLPKQDSQTDYYDILHAVLDGKNIKINED